MKWGTKTTDAAAPPLPPLSAHTSAHTYGVLPRQYAPRQRCERVREGGVVVAALGGRRWGRGQRWTATLHGGGRHGELPGRGAAKKSSRRCGPQTRTPSKARGRLDENARACARRRGTTQWRSGKLE